MSTLSFIRWQTLITIDTDLKVFFPFKEPKTRFRQYQVVTQNLILGKSQLQCNATLHFPNVIIHHRLLSMLQLYFFMSQLWQFIFNSGISNLNDLGYLNYYHYILYDKKLIWLGNLSEGMFLNDLRLSEDYLRCRTGFTACTASVPTWNHVYSRCSLSQSRSTDRKL